MFAGVFAIWIAVEYGNWWQNDRLGCGMATFMYSSYVVVFSKMTLKNIMSSKGGERENRSKKKK